MSKDASVLTQKKQGYTIYENLQQKQEQNNRNTKNFIQRINGTVVGSGNATGSLITNQAVGANVFGEFFQTPRIRLPDQDLPFVNSVSFSPLNNSSILTFTGNITGSNNSEITNAGMVWNTSGNPTLQDNVFYASTNLGEFTFTYNTFTSTQINYARAFAVNGLGIKYGTILNATPNYAPILPLVSTSEFISINDNTNMSFNGIIQSYGTTPVTQVGFVWTSTPIIENPPIPTLENGSIVTATLLSNGEFSNSFFTGITSIIQGRTFAINNAGVSYGNLVEATPNLVIQLPQMTAILFSSLNVNGEMIFTGAFSTTFFNSFPTEVGIQFSSFGAQASTSQVTRIPFTNPITPFYTLKINFVIPPYNLFPPYVPIDARAYGSNSAGFALSSNFVSGNPQFIQSPPTVSISSFQSNVFSETSFDVYGKIDNSGNLFNIQSGAVYRLISSPSDFALLPTLENSFSTTVGFDFTTTNLTIFGASYSTGIYSARTFSENFEGVSYSPNALSTFLLFNAIPPIVDLASLTLGGTQSQINFNLFQNGSNGSKVTSTGVVYTFSYDSPPSLSTINGVITPDANSYIAFVSTSAAGFNSPDTGYVGDEINGTFTAISYNSLVGRAFSVNSFGIGYSRSLSTTPIQAPVLGANFASGNQFQISFGLTLSTLGSGSFFETGLVWQFGSTGNPFWNSNDSFYRYIYSNNPVTNPQLNTYGYPPYDGYSLTRFTAEILPFPYSFYRIRPYWVNIDANFNVPLVGYGSTATVDYNL